ncbi:MAG: endonuclease III [Erysipelotrichaceae bacterium]|nr:endonuclease III [Erysipelotrichaceae bacterium]
MNKKAERILQELEQLYPDAACELHFNNVFQLLCAVTLSAQTTDESVNRVTPALFRDYPDAQSLAKASPSEIEPYIRSIGLYRNKARNLVAMAGKICEEYGGEVPKSRVELETLAGVGRKTASVVLAVGFGEPALAVDTHVARVSRRLGLAKEEDDVLDIEKKLMRAFPKEKWAKAHHQLLFFGRYLCRAQRPLCEQCPLRDLCHYL